jgi:hypothetical protein
MLKNVTPRDWGALVVSLILLGFFGAYEVAIIFLKLPKDDTMAGIVGNLVVLVAGYWIGSSSGSKSKDATIAAQANGKSEPQNGRP